MTWLYSDVKQRKYGPGDPEARLLSPSRIEARGPPGRGHFRCAATARIAKAGQPICTEHPHLAGGMRLMGSQKCSPRATINYGPMRLSTREPRVRADSQSGKEWVR